MFCRLHLASIPRYLPSAVCSFEFGTICQARCSLLRSLSTSLPLADFDRSNEGSFASNYSQQHPHPRSDRSSNHHHNDNFRSAQHRKHNDAPVISDFSSFKSPFSYTEPPAMDWQNIPGLTRPLQRSMSEEFQYKSCTPVQAAVASKMPLINDLVVQAKTGTGKTLAFLIPAVNRILLSKDLETTRNSIKVLVISPTRELALQIGKEAERLVSKCRLGVHTLVGGESKMRQTRDMMRRRCDIIVGTPGRLIDLIQNDGRFRDSLKGVQSFVLDEADRMLEIGFKEDIEAISAALPTTRHTMLFSATYPKNVEQLVKSTLQPGFEVINTISDDDVSTVHAIDQSYLIAPLKEQPLLLHSVLARAMEASSSSTPFKAIVFFPTTRAVELYSSMFRNLGNLSLPDSISVDPRRLFELHSRKTQSVRMRIADRFRDSRSAILFTSDVSARGVDYPGINLVVQMGMPMSRDQYVHRIGRTGRAGKTGSALTILSPFEKAFFDNLSELPIRPAEKGENGALLTGLGDSVVWDEEANRTAVSMAMKQLDQVLLNDAFLGNLGFYQGQVDTLRDSGYTGHKAMVEMEEFYKSLGLEYIPSLPSALRGTYAPPKPRQAHHSSSYSGSQSQYRKSSNYRSFDRGDNNSRDFSRNNDRSRSMDRRY